MLAAVAWIFIGSDIKIGRWTFEPLCVGELGAIHAFAVSWLTEIRRLWEVLRGSVPAVQATVASAA